MQRTRKYPCYSRPLEVSQDAQLQTNVPKKRVEGKKLEMRGESIRHDEQRESKGTLITFAIGAKQGSLPLAMVNVWRCGLWSWPILQRNPYSSTAIAVLAEHIQYMHLEKQGLKQRQSKHAHPLLHASRKASNHTPSVASASPGIRIISAVARWPRGPFKKRLVFPPSASDQHKDNPHSATAGSSTQHASPARQSCLDLAALFRK